MPIVHTQVLLAPVGSDELNLISLRSSFKMIIVGLERSS